MSNLSLRFALALSLLVGSALPACAMQNQHDGESESTTAEDELTLTTGKFETFTGKDGQHYFHLLAGNGEKVLASEGYSSASNANAGIASVKANGVDATRYEIRDAVDGQAYFVLKAGNGAIIGVSETYATKWNAERAIASIVKVVKSTVANAPAETGAKFQTFKGLDKEYYFHLRAANGEIVLQSEGYTTSANAKNGVASVTSNGKDARRYQLLEAANGRFYFVLRATNGQIIAVGQTYSSKYAAQTGIDTCVALLGG
jgi:uncharacterized protein YegP (UPF0339 family)